MTQDEVIDMARQSGWTNDLLEVSFVSPMLERFAKLVAAKERKTCVLECADFIDSKFDISPYSGEVVSYADGGQLKEHFGIES